MSHSGAHSGRSNYTTVLLSILSMLSTLPTLSIDDVTATSSVSVVATSASRTVLRSSDDVLVDGLVRSGLVVVSLRIDTADTPVLEPSQPPVGVRGDWWLLLVLVVPMPYLSVFLNMSGHGWGIVLWRGEFPPCEVHQAGWVCAVSALWLTNRMQVVFLVYHYQKCKQSQ